MTKKKLTSASNQAFNDAWSSGNSPIPSKYPSDNSRKPPILFLNDQRLRLAESSYKSQRSLSNFLILLASFVFSIAVILGEYEWEREREMRCREATRDCCGRTWVYGGGWGLGGRRGGRRDVGSRDWGGLCRGVRALRNFGRWALGNRGRVSSIGYMSERDCVSWFGSDAVR
jgi:hypothetical protein